VTDARRGGGVGLTRQMVLEAALRLVDEHGVDALTMRRLADELGVTPMALYNHVEGKAGLLTGVVELVAGGIRPAPAGRPWPERVGHCARELRGAYLAHPQVAALVQSATHASPALLRHMEEVLAALDDAGLGARAAARAWTGLVALVTGHVAYELGGHLSDPRAASALPEAVPHVRAVVAGAAPLDFDAAFEWVLAGYLQQVEDLAGGGCARRSRPADTRPAGSHGPRSGGG
jgi:AcrR family transcriptional regulator